MIKDYLDVSYNIKSTPFTSYPFKLSNYLIKKFELNKGQKILELGSGRAELATAFKKLGFKVTCLDNSNSAKRFAIENDLYFIGHEIKIDSKIPLPDETFDIILTKSFVEHFEDPSIIFFEAHRLLKPGGKFIVLTPDWQANFKIFFDDITHKTPFTVETMKQTLELHDFVNLSIFRFKQLPITWENKFMELLTSLIAPFVPVRTKRKFFRWSRELLLCGFGEKSNTLKPE
jgi:SAM-dependent methyltransferase